MSKFAVLIVMCSIFSLSLGDIISCYQCDPANEPCEVQNASVIKCGFCGMLVKKGYTNITEAIRKCVVPDDQGNFPCPDGYECKACNTDKCIAIKEPEHHDKNPKSSSARSKLALIVWLSVIVTVLYIH